MKVETKYLRIDELETISSFERQKPKTAAEVSEFRTLELSLKEIGLSDPFVVYKQGDKYILCDGYIRLRIIKGFMLDGITSPIDFDNILCEVVDEPDITPAQLRLESNKRSAITPSQMAEGFRDLLKIHHFNLRELGPKFGMSHQSIANYLEILKCIPEVQRAIDKKIFPMSAGKQFCVLTPEGQRTLYDSLISKYGQAPRFTRSQMEEGKESLKDSLFIASKAQRMKRSENLREKKKGAVVRRPLERSLATTIEQLEKEIRYSEEELNDKRDNLLNLLTRWELAFRILEIREYFKNTFPDN